MRITKLFLLNFFLPLLLASFFNQNKFIYFISSFIIISVIITIIDYIFLKINYLNKSFKGIRFFLFFIWEIGLANLIVAYDVITPRLHAKPGVIAIPLNCRTDIEITVLSIVISLTPGTLVLDVSSDKKTLFIHAMYIRNMEKFKANIKKKFEKPIMEILE